MENKRRDGMIEGKKEKSRKALRSFFPSQHHLSGWQCGHGRKILCTSCIRIIHPDERNDVG
jgi:hypothetical protein